MSEESSHPRVVFDCMIYLQAMISEFGPAAALLRLVDNDVVNLFVSHESLKEIGSVLTRPKIRQRNPAITDERVKALLSRVAAKSTLLDNIQQHFTYARDPKDEKYLNLAIEVGASYLVSRDNDLLDLMAGATEDSKDFQSRFPAITIIEPAAFLQVMNP